MYSLPWHYLEFFRFRPEYVITSYSIHYTKLYEKLAFESSFGVRELRKQIEKKTFERIDKADIQLHKDSIIKKGIFKDPYLLDFLELKDGYLENDLESAILKELELFILELGSGFTFVERQKRMIIDGDDFNLDLLFSIVR